ncbi:MAG TPA: RES family NAD+ phosphorylase [Bryobacteraceae bacterium]
MIVASRLCRPAYAAFDGNGGLYKAGRWHQQGYRVVYAGQSEALAALEVLVHLSSQAQIPEYVCIKARIPESIVLDLRDFGLLPPNWAAVEPTATAMIGTRWLLEKASAALRVPSVVIPRESNYVLNPEHPEFKQIIIDEPLPFEFDVRLFSAGNAARR